MIHLVGKFKVYINHIHTKFYIRRSSLKFHNGRMWKQFWSNYFFRKLLFQNQPLILSHNMQLVMSIYYFDFPFLIITCCAAILIVLEYSFFLQHNSMHLKDALESAVTEYNKSGAQVIVKTAISATVPSAKPHTSDKDDFCKNIINITLNHLMCKGHCFQFNQNSHY